MRPVLFWILIALAAQPVQGQTFNQRYDLLDMHRAQTGWDIEKTPNGYVVLQASSDVDSLAPDSFVHYQSLGMTWITPAGTLTSYNRFFLPGYGIYAGWANCCDSLPGGGFVVGSGRHSFNDESDVLLIACGPDGDTLWTRSFGLPGEQWIGRQVKRTLDGGFLVVGERGSGGQIDAFAIKTDGTGTQEWVRVYGGSLGDSFISVQPITSGGYLLGGITETSATNSDVWFVRADGNGDIVWSETYGGPYADGSGHSCLAINGDAITVSCRGLAANYASTRSHVARIELANGSELWAKEYGSASAATQLFSVVEAAHSDIVACGVQDAGSTMHGTLLRTTADGDSLWMRNYWYEDTVVSQGMGRFFDVLPTEDGGFIAAGVAYPTFGGVYDQDAWVVRVDSMGCIVPGCDGVSGISEYITNLGDALSVYPVPLRRAQGDMGLHVRIALPAHFRAEGPLMLTMTSLDGRLVRQQQVPTSATDEVTVEVSALASGTYALHLSDTQRWIAGKTFVVE